MKNEKINFKLMEINNSLVKEIEDYMTANDYLGLQTYMLRVQIDRLQNRIMELIFLRDKLYNENQKLKSTLNR
ncbi:hypothetical protein AAEX37_01083 [Oligella sp. MSHR50489EDL]